MAEPVSTISDVGHQTPGEPNNDWLRPFLAGRDVACPVCGYNLRDLPGSRCPECGDEIVLTVKMAEPMQKLLIAGLVGLSAGAGFNVGILVYLGIQIILRGGPMGTEDQQVLEFSIGGVIVMGAALTLWFRFWRRIRRMPDSGRAWLALGCWVLALVDIVLFAINPK
jgi:DNA-directed RNA polymerase subunit RPC12/RpoP